MLSALAQLPRNAADAGRARRQGDRMETSAMPATGTTRTCRSAGIDVSSRSRLMSTRPRILEGPVVLGSRSWHLNAPRVLTNFGIGPLVSHRSLLHRVALHWSLAVAALLAAAGDGAAQPVEQFFARKTV